MRTFTTEHTVYTFDELTDEAKERALTNLADINIDYDWWDAIYEDAEMIGLDIHSFDLDRGYYIEGILTDDLPQVCHAIMRDHGPTCNTYQLAETYLDKWSKLVEAYSDGIETDRVQDDPEVQDEFDSEVDDLTEVFRDELLDEYLVMLRADYDYKTSTASIIGTIEASEYEFTKEGFLA